MTRLSLSNLALAWAVLLACFALVTIPSVIQVVQAGPDEYFDNSYLLSSGNAFYVLIFIAPAVVALSHLMKVMYLNAAKETFLAGAVLLYALLAAAVSAANHAFHYTLDQSWEQTFQVVNLAAIFGWTDHGVLVGFLQQFAFMFLVAIAVHTLASLQRSWVGWLVDLMLIGLFSASLVTEPLVSVRSWLSEVLVSHSSAPVQIGSCLVAAALLYGIALKVLRRKEL
ncbi:hypothetical protein EF847_07505 [Actinobacteria bacterium YIM 96077]|uniref:Uncharacterized protein n=1 Tax=Phytoactinopolyspora halophila TaxID=1981511 RepID=A0A329QJS8_9ACTN|nr:hypothetical protein EF847_07505 [Actinobacteria bacterium YIM 96077]RAW12523.1 hypothetical protein DPM12_14085 [Phytoactinopolyspora halophila]